MKTEEEKRESKKRAQKKWKEKNKEHVKEYSKKHSHERYVNLSEEDRQKEIRKSVERAKKNPEAHRASSKRAYQKRAADPEKRAKMNAESKAYYESHREESLEYQRKYYKQGCGRNRRSARIAVAQALRKGFIVRPEKCSKCDSSEGIIESHHHNGYEPDHWLDVVWLCKKCHGRADAENRRSTEQYV